MCFNRFLVIPEYRYIGISVIRVQNYKNFSIYAILNAKNIFFCEIICVYQKKVVTLHPNCEFCNKLSLFVMKKGILILSMLSFAFAAALQAQELQNQPQEPDSIKGVHPYKVAENEKGIKPEIAHWSIIPHIGFSSFDGDFSNEKSHSFAIPSAGLALEYNFTPVWSIGVEYMYDQYTVYGKQGKDAAGNPLQNADTLLNGHLHRAGVYLSMDLINLFFPRVHKKVFSLIPYVGAGGAWYKRSAYFKDDKTWGFDKNGNEVLFNPTHGRGQTAGYINADGVVGPDHDTKYNMEGYIQAGLDLDFNLNRTLALGLRANYTYFTRDYFDGRGYHVGEASYASKNNDGIFEITANLRFKLEAVSKSHVRNMPSFDTFDKMLAAAEPKIIPHDTVIIRHDSIIVREKEIIKQAPRKDVYNVYFDNDQYTLRQDALVTIQQVADRMDEEPELYAIVIGYCDNTGGNNHNFELGDNRADKVVDELIQEYGIPSNHLYGKGSGKLVGRRSKSAYGPNRRASIHLVDEETFQLMILELNGKSEERDPSYKPTYENSKPVREPKYVPISESARKEKINEFAHRDGEKVTVEKGMSLTKLARQNYDNIYCWVYIYLANKDIIPNPNAVQDGTELLIPELTEEELKITKEESLSLYGLRHLK